jgi:hypothetical protein
MKVTKRAGPSCPPHSLGSICLDYDEKLRAQYAHNLGQLDKRGDEQLIRSTARSWRQKWSKGEAIDLVVTHLRHGEWASLLTM